MNTKAEGDAIAEERAEFFRRAEAEAIAEERAEFFLRAEAEYDRTHPPIPGPGPRERLIVGRRALPTGDGVSAQTRD
jgi:hypothetical protein